MASVNVLTNVLDLPGDYEVLQEFGQDRGKGDGPFIALALGLFHLQDGCDVGVLPVEPAPHQKRGCVENQRERLVGGLIYNSWWYIIRRHRVCTLKIVLQTSCECTIGTFSAGGKKAGMHEVLSGGISRATVAKNWYKESASSPSDRTEQSRSRENCDGY